MIQKAFEPSSKTCGRCGTINQELTLKDRVWTCENCGVIHDRDINAAKNIKAIGLKQIPTERRESMLGENRGNNLVHLNQEALAFRQGQFTTIPTHDKLICPDCNSQSVANEGGIFICKLCGWISCKNCS